MGLLYGRAGRLTGENGGFRPGQGARLETPWLDVRYHSYERLPFRPTGTVPTGALMSAYDDRTPPPASARL